MTKDNEKLDDGVGDGALSESPQDSEGEVLSVVQKDEKAALERRQRAAKQDVESENRDARESLGNDVETETGDDAGEETPPGETRGEAAEPAAEAAGAADGDGKKKEGLGRVLGALSPILKGLGDMAKKIKDILGDVSDSILESLGLKKAAKKGKKAVDEALKFLLHPDAPIFSFEKGVTPNITSGFGMRNHPITQNGRMHTGIDIAVPSGTTIWSTITGVVVKVGSVGGYGNRLGVKDASGEIHYWSHLSIINVREGETVNPGDQIAVSGATGNVTGPHIHYEVKGTNGEYKDPKEYLGFA